MDTRPEYTEEEIQETYDKVRLALGLQPLKTAIEEGEKINKNINQNL